MGEFELPKPWDPRAIEGVNRFVKRVWRLCEEWDAAKAPRRRSAPAPAPQDDQARDGGSRTNAVQHRDRGADGVPERARRGRRQPRDARRSGRDASPRRAVRPAPRRRGVGAPGRQRLHARAGVAGVRRRVDRRRDGVDRRSGRRQGARQRRHLADRVARTTRAPPRWRSPTSPSTSKAAPSRSSSTSPAASSASCRRPPDQGAARRAISLPPSRKQPRPKSSKFGTLSNVTGWLSDGCLPVPCT